MPDAFRLVVLKQICKALEATEFEYDGNTFSLEGNVFRGRISFGNDDPLPMLSILEPQEAPATLATQADNPASRNTWELLVQGFAKNDQRNPSDPAYNFMGAVRQELAKLTKPVDGSNYVIPKGGSNAVTKVTIGQPVVRPPDETSSYAFFWLPLTLVLVEDNENQFI